MVTGRAADRIAAMARRFHPSTQIHVAKGLEGPNGDTEANHTPAPGRQVPT